MYAYIPSRPPPFLSPTIHTSAKVPIPHRNCIVRAPEPSTAVGGKGGGRLLAALKWNNINLSCWSIKVL